MTTTNIKLTNLSSLSMWLHFANFFAIAKMIPLIIATNFLLCMASQILLPTIAAMATGPETDRLALLALKDKLTNGVPEALPSWNDSLHFCKWQGVTCNIHHMRVSALQLTNQNLGGTLTPSLGNFTFLKMLNLSYDGLGGQIPKQIGHLKRLQFIDLQQNNLQEEVPAELANCFKLNQIFLSHNNLIGEIPSWFGSMQQLTVLRFSDNQFHGNIPPSLGNISSLERLSLAINNLEGSIPQSLCQLSNLNLLYLGMNNFSGEIPPSFYNLSRLEYLDIACNNLSGTIPSNIDHAFPYLQTFNVANNSLSGTIPSSFSNISQLEGFSIAQNAFSGTIPTSFGRLQNLHHFFISDNNFGRGDGHDLDFLSSLTNCSQFFELSMGNCGVSGVVLPKSIGNFSSQLTALYIGPNNISGSIPEEIGQLVGLTSLDLQNNFLQGTIPHSIGMLENIGEIYLQGNYLAGQIPDAFRNLTRLFKLHLEYNNLEGTIPASFRYCKSMQFLYLGQNNFSGNITNETFVHQESLIILDVTSNSLTGPLPSEFGKLENLVRLYLGENKFIGDIPLKLGECLMLTDLDMRGNFFQGSIPSTFQSLKSLQNLDLSSNNLSGTISTELKDLPMLETLNLSYNHFQGEVPKGGVFDNVSATSLTGNVNLCGGIPQLKLPTCSNKSKEPFKIVTLIIVISGAFACSLTFLMICLRGKQKKLPSSPSSLQNAHLNVSYRELYDATNGFSSSNLIGIGSFGSVYQGILHHYGRPVAIKVLNLQTRGATKSFIAECKTLGKIQHRNLLKILTSCSSVDYKGDDFKALVFEFMPNGSLEKWLSNEYSEPKNLHLNFNQRLDIAIDVAHALHYLHHDFGETIVHCDIKPSNILLDADMVAHLGDFGLARLLHSSYSNNPHQTTSSIKGTIGYIPPEYGEGGRVTTQGDIYSYGVLLLEMLTGKKPTDSMFCNDLSLPKFCKLAMPERVLEIVDSTLLVVFDRDNGKALHNSNMEHEVEESLLRFAKSGVACCAALPWERMKIKDVLAELVSIKQKLSALNIII